MTRDRLMGTAIAAALVVRGLFVRRRSATLAQRLAAFPGRAPLEHPVTIHWNAHHIPFIEAASDTDLATALGMVHAHLRLGQLELMRRLAQGRIAELVGPLGVDLDIALRLLDVTRAVPAIIAGLAPDVRAWAEGFLRGLNHVQATVAELPEEMRLLGIDREPWTLFDLFANARLAAADVSWIVFGRLLRARAALPPAEWRALWPRLLQVGMASPETALAGALARVGSNAAAVAGWRSASGGALFAADPHLSVSLPNIWLAAGMASPSINVVGLMPAGFPIVAIGRNRHIAWGGTSLHAAATDLFDVRDEPLRERRVMLRVRGEGDRAVTLRESAAGPVVSDGMLMRHPTPVALRWVGHTPSDEMGAMLAVMRADGSTAFARALEGFAVPGQNMLHATAGGHVGHLLALAAPRRPNTPPPDLLLPLSATAHWSSFAHTPEFPNRIDPPSGVVASANDRAPPSSVPAGFFFSPSDRVDRLHERLDGDAKLTLADMAATQTDVQGRLEPVRALVARLPDHPARTVLAAWDGRYDAQSVGALVFEAVTAALAQALLPQAGMAPLAAVWTGRRMIAQDILAQPDAALHPAARTAMDEAMRLVQTYQSWGGVHRMRLQHYLGAVPLLGRRYRFGEYASPGGNDTLDKTGHGPVRGPHAVSYGASARFLADMADADANRVVLLGGQDGALGSETFLDQAPLWQRGEAIPLPLRPETARAWPHRMVVSPA